VDANWTPITFTLDDQGPPPPAVLTADAGGAYHEIEDNDRKLRANIIGALSAGQSIVGNTIGTSTTVTGPASADYFRVRTAPAPLAIYKHQLALTSATAGHTATIRGLTQSDGVINPGTDLAFQTAPATTRTVQWYGFGRQEEVYYAVAGNSGTTADYSAAYSRSPVVPTDAGTFIEGPITIDRDPANFADVDFIVYESGLNPVPGYMNDGPDTLTRDYAAGTYYIAWSNWNTSNDQPAPPDDTYRSEPVLDFPHAVANNSVAAGSSIDLRITDASGVPVTVPAMKDSAFDVVWVRFTVVPPNTPTNPHGTGAASPPTVQATRDTLLTVHAVGGQNPPSTALSVRADLSSIGGAASQVFYDDGTHGDQTPDDSTFSYLATVSPTAGPGPRVLPFTIADAQQRSGTGGIALTITAAPTGGCCTAGACEVMSRYDCLQAGGTYNGDGSDCSGTLSDVRFASADPFPLLIPDAISDGVVPGSVTSTIAAPPGSGVVSHLAVDVGITHSYIGDVKIRIEHDGVQVALETRPGVLNDATQTGSACNYDGVYTFFDASPGDVWAVADAAGNATDFDIPGAGYHPAGRYSPALPSPSLAAFDGMNFDGVWTLTVEDWWGLDTGFVTAFNLRTQTPRACGPVCGSADFNCDGDTGTDMDIEAFFTCLAGSCPPPPCAGRADFNGDGDVGTDADIEAFFRVLGGGHC
jgi:hypothetical protein